MKRLALLLTVAFFMVAATGCQKAYYSAMEKVGYHKRDILVDRVENAQDSQQDAKEQFANALERYRSVVDVDGGELEQKYDVLNSEYEASLAIAEKVRSRINSVEDVAGALFEEWGNEIKEYSSPKLRKSSQAQLSATRSRYSTLIKAMKKASSRMDPVLAAFKDQVLFLKHNLNAKAIAALEGELDSINSDVAALIKEMEKSIAEADAFIKTLE